MFDWRKRVEILRAENALRDGRLDEAYSIAMDKELKRWRGCQVILEKLVKPLLDRAAEHLEEGRLQDALADVERAREAGGNRPQIAELRETICARLSEDRHQKALERDLLQSARRHLEKGSVGAGRALLEGVRTDPETARLRREAERREEKAREACIRSEMLLKEGAILEAVRSAQEALIACARYEKLPSLLLKLKNAAISAIDRALLDGSLNAAQELFGKIMVVCGESLETRRLGEIFRICHEAAQKTDSGNYDDARCLVNRLRALLPSASWIKTTERALLNICEGLQGLHAGPLSGFSLEHAEGAKAALESTIQAPRPLKKENGKASMRDRLLLWVDGVGAFLVLRSDRVTIGRLGSSARPDLALTADIAGVQAEIVRADDDYFLAAHGAAEVNGKKVEKKLLASGDRIRLAPKCELLFQIPTALSTSAVITLPSLQRIAGDAREVILLDHHLLIGNDEGCHIRTREATSKILLYSDARGLSLRADEDILMGGELRGREALIEPGVQIKVGEVTFAVTPLEGEY